MDVPWILWDFQINGEGAKLLDWNEKLKNRLKFIFFANLQEWTETELLTAGGITVIEENVLVQNRYAAIRVPHLIGRLVAWEAGELEKRD